MPKKPGRKSKFGRKSDGAKKISNWRKSQDINELRKKNAKRMDIAIKQINLFIDKINWKVKLICLVIILN